MKRSKRRVGYRIRMLRKQAGLKTRDDSIGIEEWRSYVASFFCNPIREAMSRPGFARRAFNIESF